MSRPWTCLVLVLALCVSAHTVRAGLLAASAHDEQASLRGFHCAPPVLKRLSGAGLDARLRASSGQQLALRPTADVCSTRASLRTPAATAFAFDHHGCQQHRAHPGRAPPPTRPT